MPPDPLHRSVVRPHRNLSPWFGGALLAAGGLSALVAVALTPVREAAPPPPPVQVVADPAPAPPDPVPPPPAPVPCVVHDKDEYDLARWSIGPDHFGPISTCAPVTSELLASLLPGYAVSTEIVGEGESVTYVLANRYERLLQVWPPDPGDDEQPIRVVILSASIPTPEGIRVGSRLHNLRALHPDVTCEYAGAEGDDYIYCTRSDAEDPWRYYLRLSDISRAYRRAIETATGEFEIDLDRIANARIESIAWQSGQ
jgi:hypothetical protein